jgi:hypothetical protein
MLHYETPKPTKQYIEVKSKKILKMYSNVPWREQGFWILHYDLAQIDEAWTRLQEMYLAKQLSGVIRVCLANQPRDEAKALFCFVGPATDKTLCLDTGKLLLEALNYSRQPCHQASQKCIYYKLRGVQSHLYQLPF